MKECRPNSDGIRRGFTLIELLIVVAIIAILAAIAVPNFLEAQTRAKVSRVRADLRSIATALESYRIDWNLYPPTPFVSGGDSGVLRVVPNVVSTPVAYLTTANFPDPFVAASLGDFQGLNRMGQVVTYGPDPAYPLDPGGDPSAGQRFYYQSNQDPRRSPATQAALLDAIPVEGYWVLASLGPNRRRDLIVHPSVPTLDVLEPYDATNGTVSGGDIVRSQKESQGTLTP